MWPLITGAPEGLDTYMLLQSVDTLTPLDKAYLRHADDGFLGSLVFVYRGWTVYRFPLSFGGLYVIASLDVTDAGLAVEYRYDSLNKACCVIDGVSAAHNELAEQLASVKIYLSDVG